MKTTAAIIFATLQCFTPSLSQESAKRSLAESIHQNRLRVEFSLPFVNNLYLHKDAGRSDYLPVGGFSAGFEMASSPDQVFTLKVGSTIDIQFQADWISNRHYRNSYQAFFVTSCYYFVKHNVSYGIGVHYTKLTWERASEQFAPGTSRANDGWGILASLRYALDEHLFVGLNYQPTFLQRSPDRIFEYQHFVSLEVSLIFQLLAGAA